MYDYKIIDDFPSLISQANLEHYSLDYVRPQSFNLWDMCIFYAGQFWYFDGQAKTSI